MPYPNRPLKNLLLWLIVGTKGGITRTKIIETLKESPRNANQLTNILDMDYKTIIYVVIVFFTLLKLAWCII